MLRTKIMVGLVLSIIAIQGCAFKSIKIGGKEFTRDEITQMWTKYTDGRNEKEADELVEEGFKLASKSLRKEALEKFEEASSIYKKLDKKSKIGRTFIFIGDIYSTQNSYSQALSYFNRALEISKVTNDKSLESSYFLSVSNIYLSQGNYAQALSSLEKFLAISKEIGFKPGIPAALTRIGMVYTAKGDYDQALSYLQQALAIQKELGDKAEDARIFLTLGIVYSDQGDLSQALSYYQKALKIKRESGEEEGIGNCLNNIGGIYWDQGNYLKALSCYQKALKIYKVLGVKNKEGASLTNLGSLYNELGDTNKALVYLHKALEIYKATGNKRDMGTNLSNVGGTYATQGNYVQALSSYQKALMIYDQINYTGTNYEAVQNAIGLAYLALNQDKQAFEILKKSKSPIGLGQYYLKKNNYIQAQKHFLQDSEENTPACWIGLGKSYEGLKQYKASAENYKKAVEFMEHQRESLPEAARTYFLAGKVELFPRIETYEGLVRVSEKLGHPEKAFFWAENTRARLLAEQIAGKHKAGSFQIPSDLAENERELIDKIAANYKQQEVASQKDNNELLKRLEQGLKPLKEEQNQLIERLRREYPRYAAIRYPQPIQAKHVPLKPNEVIIEYEVTEPYTLCMVVRNGKVEKIITISKTRQEMAELIKKFRQPFESGHDLAKFDNRLGGELYNLLLKDALNGIPQMSQLIVIPDEVISLVPFEALTMGIENTGKPKYVSDQWLISYYQSATVINLNRKLQRPHTPTKQLFALGDAVYSKQDTRAGTLLAMRGTIDDRNILISPLDLAHEFGEKELGYRFPRLENTRSEVEAVGKLFPQHTLLLGPDASEENIKSLPLDQYRYTLFSTHGILGNNLPYIKEPALVLNLIGNQKEDGFLTMSEIFNLKLDADLVTLSACQTGLGTQVAGEGLMGLSRAFMYAGTDTVIATLWSVADKSTSKFMVKFFEGIKSGKDKLTALREAKLHLRNNGYEHPFYWAPFILIGEH